MAVDLGRVSLLRWGMRVSASYLRLLSSSVLWLRLLLKFARQQFRVIAMQYDSLPPQYIMLAVLSDSEAADDRLDLDADSFHGDSDHDADGGSHIPVPIESYFRTSLMWCCHWQVCRTRPIRRPLV